MNDIVIRVTIPHDEYKDWNDFESNGVDECQKNIETDIREFLKYQCLANSFLVILFLILFQN